MLEVTAFVWMWNPGKGSWHFLTIPPEQAVEIKLQSVGMRGGFGSVKVSVQIGQTRWQTSVFPDRKTGGYILPIKADVRRREDIAAGDEVTLTLDLA
ncbi:DUF1905 domain-containing protein [Aquisediminimonas sediminicola]|uniref:DUF1905 domain-containing protein n=1 Tax=Alteraquisediminimonas sediminicola TaxID=2676787 RepID=UPI001C8DDCA2|nr:DUF1905 domain-containing protein [Aquisediminimonas sediminicola]